MILRNMAVRLLLSVPWLACFPVVAASQSLSAEVSPELFLGAGFDREANSYKDTCLTRRVAGQETTLLEPASNLQNVPQEGLTSVTYNISSISNRKELEEALSVSASGSFGGASASASFSRNVRVDQFNAHALVQMRVVTPPQLLRNVKLSDEAVRLFQQSPERFRQVCGDSYVVSIVRGGELNGLVTVFTRTQEEKRQFQASASGSYGGASASGSVAQSFRELLETRSTNVRAFYRGTDGTNDAPQDIESLFEFATQFPGEVYKFSTPYAITVRSYETVINFPSSDPFPRTARNDVITELYDNRLLVMGWRDDVSFIIENPQLFIDPNIDDLVAYLNEANNTLDEIEERALSCIDRLDECTRFTNMIRPPTLPAWRAESCVERRSPLCGVELHLAARSEACGVSTFNEASGPQCGVAGYETKRSALCGAELYQTGEAAVCGGLRLPLRPNMIVVPANIIERCPFERGAEPYDVCRERETRKTCEENGYAFVTRHQAVEELGEGIFSSWNRTGAICFRWQSCRHPTFGVERYNSCAHPDHGIIYSSCRHEAFGVQDFNECRDPSHGVELYSSCRILSDESGVCPG
jgi:hypothetical protein